MYKQEKPELEEYLLGRKIDKHIDEDASQETESREFLVTQVVSVKHQNIRFEKHQHLDILNHKCSTADKLICRPC